MDEEAMIRAAVADWNVWHGREAIRAGWGDQFGSIFSNMHTDILEMVRGPRRWLVRARTTMHGEGSGVDVESTAFMVFEAENDLATEVWLFLDEAPARAQAEV